MKFINTYFPLFISVKVNIMANNSSWCICDMHVERNIMRSMLLMQGLDWSTLFDLWYYWNLAKCNA